MPRQQVLVEMRDVTADDRREHERHAQLIAQGSRQLGPQGTKRRSLGIRKVGEVRNMPVRLDDEMAEGGQTVSSRLAVVDPELIVAAD